MCCRTEKIELDIFFSPCEKYDSENNSMLPENLFLFLAYLFYDGNPVASLNKRCSIWN